MRQVIAIGGGGFGRTQESNLIEQYILDQTSKKKPKICFIPTATGDWGMVSGVIVSDHASAGNILLHGSLTTPRDVKNGDVFKFNAGDLDITFA